MRDLQWVTQVPVRAVSAQCITSSIEIRPARWRPLPRATTRGSLSTKSCASCAADDRCGTMDFNPSPNAVGDKLPPASRTGQSTRRIGYALAVENRLERLDAGVVAAFMAIESGGDHAHVGTQ